MFWPQIVSNQIITEKKFYLTVTFEYSPVTTVIPDYVFTSGCPGEMILFEVNTCQKSSQKSFCKNLYWTKNLIINKKVGINEWKKTPVNHEHPTSIPVSMWSIYEPTNSCDTVFSLFSCFLTLSHSTIGLTVIPCTKDVKKTATIVAQSMFCLGGLFVKKLWQMKGWTWINPQS